MDEQLLTSLRREVQVHYEQRYGPATVHFDQFIPLADDSAYVQVTISKGDRFITRYYGTVAYQNNRLHTDVRAI